MESIVAGIKIKAHPLFRLVATMNDDASTFDLPEYIHSRLQPQILIDFPERHEEFAILRENLPFGDEHILNYVTDFLQHAHAAEERYTARDGINIARYAIKLRSLATYLWRAKKFAEAQTAYEEAVQLSDEVIVISPRPGRIVRRVKLDLPRPRDLHLRKSPELQGIVAEIKEIFLSYGLI